MGGQPPREGQRVVNHASHDADGQTSHQAHDKHEGHSPEMFRDRLVVSLLLTVPILYFSEQIQAWFGYEAVSFAGTRWVNPILSTALFVYAGTVFLMGGSGTARSSPG